MTSNVVDLGAYRWLRLMERMYGKDIARQFGEVLSQLERGTFADPNVPSMDEESCPCFVCQMLDARASRRLSHPGKP